MSGDDIFKFPKLHFTVTAQESKAISETPNPKIIIAGSGMSNGGRVVHHEKTYLPGKNNVILIIGYESAGTLGRQLQDGARCQYRGRRRAGERQDREHQRLLFA